MEGFLPILLIVAAIAILAIAVRRMGKETKPPEPCQLHKWTYKGEAPNDYMVCEKCGQLPGTDIQWSLDEYNKN